MPPFQLRQTNDRMRTFGRMPSLFKVLGFVELLKGREKLDQIAHSSPWPWPPSPPRPRPPWRAAAARAVGRPCCGGREREEGKKPPFNHHALLARAHAICRCVWPWKKAKQCHSNPYLSALTKAQGDPSGLKTDILISGVGPPNLFHS